MSNKQEPKVFTFNESNQPIRVEVINGEPWFVAKDVAKALGIGWRGDTLLQIPDEWKGVRKFRTPGGEQELTVISEAGMYKLAFRCHSSEVADKFTNFVVSEVLPSIRKTGRYEVGPASGGRTVRRAPRRATMAERMTVELMNLLWLIDESLNIGDRKNVALELGVSRVTVCNVLAGRVRNAKVLMALYQKAKDNRACGLLYQRPELMSARLCDEESLSEAEFLRHALPSVAYGKRKRGGQLGNQNARKHWRKGGK